jgi:peroxiredoxin
MAMCNAAFRRDSRRLAGLGLIGLGLNQLGLNQLGLNQLGLNQLGLNQLGCVLLACSVLVSPASLLAQPPRKNPPPDQASRSEASRSEASRSEASRSEASRSEASRSEASRGASPPARDDTLVPQVLLNLLHAPEVQQELHVTGGKLSSLEELFEELDGDCWRARNLPPAQQRQVTARAEARARQWLQKHLPAADQERIEQLERRAQGTRMLLRADVARQLQLTAEKRRELVQVAQGTETALQKVQTALRAGKSDDALQAELLAAQQRERQALRQFLTPEQTQRLSKLIGPDFDTSQLQRIYPLAPELQPAENWLNSPPLTLRELRGKVVLLHFYAFQCINCQRNLPIYSGWHEKFKDRGVVVLGIQTPETQAERDPAAVRAAAAQERIAYPVLVDLDSANWKAWSNTMWPTVYVIDQDGYIRSWWQGELKWEGATRDKQLEDLVEQLLSDREKASE